MSGTGGPGTGGPGPRAGALVTTASVLTALAAAAGVVALHRVFVATAHGQAVDEAALVGAQDRLWRLEDGANAVLDTVSVLGVVAAVAVVAVVALVQRRVRLALAAAVLVAGSLLTTQVAKRQLLDRPDLDVTLQLPNSLPSGHTTFAAAVAAAALLVAPVRLRPLVAVCGAGYAAAVGVATLAAGWHRPSDAVAAALVVLGWGAVVLPLAGGRPAGRSGSSGRVVAGTVLVAGAAVGLVGGSAALVAVWASVPPEPAGRLGQVVAGAGGALGVGGAACAALLVLLLLQRAADRVADRGPPARTADRTADRTAAGEGPQHVPGAPDGALPGAPGRGAGPRGGAGAPPQGGTVLAPRAGGAARPPA